MPSEDRTREKLYQGT